MNNETVYHTLWLHKKEKKNVWICLGKVIQNLKIGNIIEITLKWCFACIDIIWWIPRHLGQTSNIWGDGTFCKVGKDGSGILSPEEMEGGVRDDTELNVQPKVISPLFDSVLQRK